MKVEEFDPKKMIDYLKKSIENQDKIQSQKAWIIRYAFMLKFGLDETMVDAYIERLNYLIEHDEIEITIGYEPTVLTKNFIIIETIKHFAAHYNDVKARESKSE